LPGPERPRQRPGRGAGAARAFTGSLAAGLLVLALGLAGMQYWANRQGQPGPGVPIVLGHFVAALAALVLQMIADRRRDLIGGLSAVAILVIVVGAIWMWWWA
jgi:hypothetical protein